MEHFTSPPLVLCLSLLCCYTNGQILTLSADNVTASYNGTAFLKCSATINSTYEVNVTFETIQRSPPLNRNTLNYSVHAEGSMQVLTLTLTEVLLSDSGVFTCSATATNKSYEESKTVLFTLEILNYYYLIQSVSAPNVSVSLGDPATLICTVKANETAVAMTDSEVAISIEKLGNNSVISNHTEQYKGMFSKEIKIFSVRHDDLSPYMCAVKIGEEETVVRFYLTALNGVTASSMPPILPFSSSPSSSPMTSNGSGSDIDTQQLIFIIIIVAVVVITAIILFAVVCYFLAANFEICYNKDKMRMNEMDAKMKKSMKNGMIASLYDQELGPYAHNEAYNVDLDEEEIEEVMEERQQWEEHSRSLSKWKKKKGSFSVQERRHSYPLGQEVMDYHQRDEYSSSDSSLEERYGGTSWQNPAMRRGPPSSQTVTTDVDSGEVLEETTSESEQSVTDEDESDDESDDSRHAAVPQVVSTPNKTGIVRKSSLSRPSRGRPKLKKKVSMGSVEVLDDEGEEIVAKRVDFNDEDKNDKEKEKKLQQHDKAKDIYPKKETAPLMSMDDVMNYLDDARKTPTKTSGDTVPLTLQSAPVKKPSFKRQPTPLPSKDEQNATAFPYDDGFDDDDSTWSGRRRSRSLILPKKTDNSGFFGRNRVMSFKDSKKEGKKKQKFTKTSDKKSSLYRTGNADVFY